MENDRYGYSPKNQRPPLRWPKDERIALIVVPNIEHFRLDRPGASPTNRTGEPNVPAFVARDYGNRVGIWHLYELMDQYRLRGTVALNSDVCNFEPEVIRAGVSRGWEWMGHGKTNSQYMSGLDEATERSVIQEVVQIIGAATGIPPRGWLGPAGAESIRTPDLLAEAGIDYVMDWTADDEPFPMRVAQGRLISVPYGTVGDLPSFIQQGWTGEQFYRLIVDTFDFLYEEGQRTARIFTLSLHPWVIGRPGRLPWLARAFEHMLKHDQIWLPSGSELADWYFQHYYEDAIRRIPLPSGRSDQS